MVLTGTGKGGVVVLTHNTFVLNVNLHVYVFMLGSNRGLAVANAV